MDANNRQLHQSEKELAKKLASQSKGKYTQQEIEEQMRGMSATVNGTKEVANASTVVGEKPSDLGGTWLLAGITTDGKPIYIGSLQDKSQYDSAQEQSDSFAIEFSKKLIHCKKFLSLKMIHI